MKRLNVLRVLKKLKLPSGMAEPTRRLLLTLENPSSEYYNPHAAETIRNLLQQILTNGKRRDYFLVLFLGQYESLLLNTRTDFDPHSMLNVAMGAATGNTSSTLPLLKPVSKVILQEKIDSLLYARPERIIYPLEGYNTNVRLGTENGQLMIYTSVMIYLNNTPDINYRQNKIDYLTRRANNPTTDKFDAALCKRLADLLRVHLNDANTEGGDSFNRLLRKVFQGSDIPEEAIKKCIKARNAAVHEGKAKCSNSTFAILLYQLILSEVAMEKSDNSQVEQTVARELARDRFNMGVSRFFQMLIPTILACSFIYYIVSFAIGSYIGKTDMQRLSWPIHDSQFNARINELIATKDTAQLIEVRNDLKWIDENINNAPNTNKR